MPKPSYLLFLVPFFLAGAAMAQAVASIQIEGNQRIETSAIETYLALEPGADASPYELDLALKRLYDTGFFSDVTVSRDGNLIRVKVIENPSINRVVFEGNDHIKTEDLEKEITLKARSIYSRTRVQQDLKRLLDVYRRNGRYSAEITPKIIALEQNRIDLVYEITEGPSAAIQKITFIGNEAFSSSTLENVITSQVSAWYKFLGSNDKYDPDRLQFDQEQLRRFYFANGFADFKVTSAIAELSPNRDAFFVTFTIEEGPVYRFDKVNIETALDPKRTGKLKALLTTRQGDLYNATEIETSIDALVKRLGDKGFAFVNVDPKTTRNKGKNPTIDLTYKVSEGPRVYVDRINIYGNQGTLDEVIRREFQLGEGDPYSTSKLKRSEERLNRLDFFEKVNIQNTPGSAPDKTNIEVEVQEKSTGEITFGAGFSTQDGVLADVGIKERNFRGRGQEVTARALVAAQRTQFQLGFTEPYFLGRNLSAGFDLYRSTQNLQSEASFDRSATGLILRSGFAISPDWRYQARYSYEFNEITNSREDASIYIKEQEGQTNTSAVGQSFFYDKRDNPRDPTSGTYFRLNQDLAGLGGDQNFFRNEIYSSYHHPLAKKWTGSAGLSAGNISGIGEDVAINQRFFIGSNEFLGFQTAGIGPRDLNTDDALGGENFYIGNAEVKFPLGFPEDLGVSGVAFVYAGSVFGLDQSGPSIANNSSLRASGGFGIAWASPFGPIRVDFSNAFLKESYDKTQLVNFGFGTRF
ncbi:MAG: outer membrane protein assembly factor BamA [Alphaproteobacteria bacterium]